MQQLPQAGRALDLVAAVMQKPLSMVVFLLQLVQGMQAEPGTRLLLLKDDMKYVLLEDIQCAQQHRQVYGKSLAVKHMLMGHTWST
jgi:hypothetical protein